MKRKMHNVEVDSYTLSFECRGSVCVLVLMSLNTKTHLGLPFILKSTKPVLAVLTLDYYYFLYICCETTLCADVKGRPMDGYFLYL